MVHAPNLTVHGLSQGIRDHNIELVFSGSNSEARCSEFCTFTQQYREIKGCQMIFCSHLATHGVSKITRKIFSLSAAASACHYGIIDLMQK
jgi:hypothetical protein